MFDSNIEQTVETNIIFKNAYHNKKMLRHSSRWKAIYEMKIINAASDFIFAIYIID